MTKKRFRLQEADYHIYSDILDENGNAIRNDKIVDLLNAQHEEIQDQKRQLDELDGLLNKFEVTFEELEDILYMNRSRL